MVPMEWKVTAIYSTRSHSKRTKRSFLNACGSLWDRWKRSDNIGLFVYFYWFLYKGKQPTHTYFIKDQYVTSFKCNVLLSLAYFCVDITQSESDLINKRKLDLSMLQRNWIFPNIKWLFLNNHTTPNSPVNLKWYLVQVS